jgi:hypothetical protein
VLALLKTASFWMRAASIAALLGAGWKVLDTYYDRGYADAEAALQEQIAEMRAENARLRSRNETLAREAAEENIRVEERIVERVRTVEREVPVVVERTVAAECRDLGPDVQRLFNDAIRAAGGEGSPAGPAAEPAAALP